MPDASSPTLALLAPGAMGAALAARLSAFGAGTILTNLDGRSETTIQRAHEANMRHASYAEIVERAGYIYSVIPPADAFGIAEAVLRAYREANSTRPLVFVDCNAINPESAKRMAGLFADTPITFLDGAIIGTPPTDSFNPAMFVTADPQDAAALEDFVRMSTQFGLNVVPLMSEGAAVGDASAVKMAHAGIVKGMIGLFTTMILAANESSPSTAEGLLQALNFSQPVLVDLIIEHLPVMLPKAYRFVGELQEIGGFVGAGSPVADTFQGLSQTFARVAQSAGAPSSGDAAVLLKFVEQARNLRN
ncbi:6-phosphogluconate dehydrogenase C-terminal domain-like protein [Mycena belliarum]|uniref:6-phosphogluconate dehydrogenase C-terminal domain-like protein n=1 Tax=Mycena belliarum TaxID=1033014 RepID=A0AAD6UKU7_9AGAR|nr:6-phosphogluconate dehydrogenase C-terminal domain-like protein [Mycena belliae]